MSFTPHVAVVFPQQNGSVVSEPVTLVPPQSPPPGYPIHLDHVPAPMSPASQPAPVWTPMFSQSSWNPVQTRAMPDPVPVAEQDAFTAHRSHGLLRPTPTPSPDQREVIGGPKVPTPTNDSFRRRRCGCFRV